MNRKQEGDQSSIDSKRTITSETVKDLTEIFLGGNHITINNPLIRNSSKGDIPPIQLDSQRNSRTSLNPNINQSKLRQNNIPVRGVFSKV